MDTQVADERKAERETRAAGETRAGRDGTGAEGRRPFSDFEVRSELGKGGMATVYLAVDRASGRSVALKVVHAHLAGDPQLVRRFEHEVAAQAALSHPNLVEVVGHGEDPSGRPFMALEYLDGTSLKELVRGRGAVPADVALLVAREVARGLEAAHERGLVHRDVKPANVLVTTTGAVKLADFGIAKTAEMTRLTSTGNVIGTPAYMSPEQAMARPVDGRSDLFSLGVLLHELLVGANPFLADNPATTLSRVVSHRPRPLFESRPEIPPRVESLLERLLAKEPEGRPATAGEVAAELQRCIESEELESDAGTLAAFVDQPAETSAHLARRAARRHFRKAVASYRAATRSGAPPEAGVVEGAIWELFLATQLDPGDEEARSWLEQVSSERGYRVRDRPHPRVAELEAKLADDPDHLPTLLQLAKLHKSQGNFLRVVHYYRRATALRPPDRYTQAQIETLLAAQAATAVAGVAARPRATPTTSGPVAPAATEAAGVADFVAPFLRSGWGRAAAGLAGLVVAVFAFGGLFDSAVHASRSDLPAADRLDASLASEPGWELLDAGRREARAGDHEAASKTLRRLAEKFPSSPYRTEGLFLLGDALERRGERPEALAVHRDNVAEAGLGDSWAARSQLRVGELLRLAGDAEGARLAYGRLADAVSGELRHDALVALGEIAFENGEHQTALHEHGTVLRESESAERRTKARLALAEVHEAIGDQAAAARHYREVAETTDHRSDAFAAAQEGLERVGRGT